MDRQLDALEQVWERYVGFVTPAEFMEVEPDSDIDRAVKRYVESMRSDCPDIEAHADEIAEYLHLYLDSCHP